MQAALDILRRDSEVLKCYNDRWDAIWYAELGSSAAVLNAGYNIASLLHRCAAPLQRSWLLARSACCAAAVLCGSLPGLCVEG